MAQPSPDDLEVAFQRITTSCPLASSDSSQQSDTIYNIITSLPEAETYHRLLEEHPSLVALLGDSSNGEFTLFLPVNAAWEKATGLLVDAADAGVLSMHISEHFIDEAYLRSMTNIPTAHEPDTSNGPQVFPIRLAEDGWTVDRAGRFTQPSIRASNGIIYCIDRVILPPPPLRDVLRARGSYSTLLHAMQASGFDEELATQRGKGGTLFAPSDQAFAALGPDALQFLTEHDEGRPYLKALLKLHFCPENTFYTNLIWPKNNSGTRRTSADKDQVYKGKLGMELSSALKRGEEASELTISITRYMSCITMAVNSVPVVEQDIGGNDGVAQGIEDVLLPGGTVGKGSQDVVGKIKSVLQPFV
ncbi:FAS1 domain protein [Akanthomyces lecanii RCEF 1005]|uniref:FAS1 domain protein n=1 Tax=Akanthomyces lecanii RCEF 1005 TaxID=1081108 RepID=A0A162N475_CORDF|nr:FAS1 domain protein [Akanthomyces lecanii RCEF 1005]